MFSSIVPYEIRIVLRCTSTTDVRVSLLTRLSPSSPSLLAVELRESADEKQKQKTTMQTVGKDNSVTYKEKFNL